MAFVNERIPEADVEKYGLEKIDNELLSIGKTYSRTWTIDRARHLSARSSDGPGRAVPHLDLDLLLEGGADLVQAGGIRI